MFVILPRSLLRRLETAYYDDDAGLMQESASEIQTLLSGKASSQTLSGVSVQGTNFLLLSRSQMIMPWHIWCPNIWLRRSYGAL